MIIKQNKNAHYVNDDGNKTDIYCIKKTTTTTNMHFIYNIHTQTQ